MKIVRSLSIGKELNSQVQDYCKSTGRTVSGLITLLLGKYLSEREGDLND